MAGIGFQLRKLFDKQGLFNMVKAYSYSSVISVGPMLACMAMLLVIQIMLFRYQVPFAERELFLVSTVYSFIFSFIVTNIMSIFITRTVSDMLYLKQYGQILPSLYGSLKLNMIIASVPGLLFVLFSKLELVMKINLFLFFMVMVMIWSLSLYISAMKEYRRIVMAFMAGALIAIAGTYTILEFTSWKSAAAVLFIVVIGFSTTACMLLVQADRFFRTKEQASDFLFLTYSAKYRKLITFGALSAVGLYAHQFIQWFSEDGVIVAGSFLWNPVYDVAVYYAFLSVIPTLIMFVVSLETSFYPKYRKYYDTVLGNGTMSDIRAALKEMYRVLMYEISFMMGVQLFFSIVSIALGIRLLPLIGFTSEQLDIFNILIFGFFMYIVYNVVSLILLYFDDRRGVVWLAVLFLASNTVFTIVSVISNERGFSFFAAAFLTLVCSFARLLYYLRRINYYTFSAQPLVNREKKSIFSRWIKA